MAPCPEIGGHRQTGEVHGHGHESGRTVLNSRFTTAVRSIPGCRSLKCVGDPNADWRGGPRPLLTGSISRELSHNGQLSNVTASLLNADASAYAVAGRDAASPETVCSLHNRPRGIVRQASMAYWQPQAWASMRNRDVPLSAGCRSALRQTACTDGSTDVATRYGSPGGGRPSEVSAGYGGTDRQVTSGLDGSGALLRREGGSNTRRVSGSQTISFEDMPSARPGEIPDDVPSPGFVHLLSKPNACAEGQELSLADAALPAQCCERPPEQPLEGRPVAHQAAPNKPTEQCTRAEGQNSTESPQFVTNRRCARGPHVREVRLASWEELRNQGLRRLPFLKGPCMSGAGHGRQPLPLSIWRRTASEAPLPLSEAALKQALAQEYVEAIGPDEDPPVAPLQGAEPAATHWCKSLGETHRIYHEPSERLTPSEGSAASRAAVCPKLINATMEVGTPLEEAEQSSSVDRLPRQYQQPEQTCGEGLFSAAERQAPLSSEGCRPPNSTSPPFPEGQEGHLLMPSRLATNVPKPLTSLFFLDGGIAAMALQHECNAYQIPGMRPHEASLPLRWILRGSLVRDRLHCNSGETGVSRNTEGRGGCTEARPVKQQQARPLADGARASHTLQMATSAGQEAPDALGPNGPDTCAPPLLFPRSEIGYAPRKQGTQASLLDCAPQRAVILPHQREQEHYAQGWSSQGSHAGHAEGAAVGLSGRLVFENPLPPDRRFARSLRGLQGIAPFRNLQKEYRGALQEPQEVTSRGKEHAEAQVFREDSVPHCQLPISARGRPALRIPTRPRTAARLMADVTCYCGNGGHVRVTTSSTYSRGAPVQVHWALLRGHYPHGILRLQRRVRSARRHVGVLRKQITCQQQQLHQALQIQQAQLRQQLNWTLSWGSGLRSESKSKMLRWGRSLRRSSLRPRSCRAACSKAAEGPPALLETAAAAAAAAVAAVDACEKRAQKLLSRPYPDPPPTCESARNSASSCEGMLLPATAESPPIPGGQRPLGGELAEGTQAEVLAAGNRNPLPSVGSPRGLQVLNSKPPSLLPMEKGVRRQQNLRPHCDQVGRDTCVVQGGNGARPNTGADGGFTGILPTPAHAAIARGNPLHGRCYKPHAFPCQPAANDNLDAFCPGSATDMASRLKTIVSSIAPETPRSLGGVNTCSRPPRPRASSNRAALQGCAQNITRGEETWKSPLANGGRGTGGRYRCNAVPLAYRRDPSLSIFSQLFEDRLRRQTNILILRRQKELGGLSLPQREANSPTQAVLDRPTGIAVAPLRHSAAATSRIPQHREKFNRMPRGSSRHRLAHIARDSRGAPSGQPPMDAGHNCPSMHEAHMHERGCLRLAHSRSSSSGIPEKPHVTKCLGKNAGSCPEDVSCTTMPVTAPKGVNQPEVEAVTAPARPLAAVAGRSLCGRGAPAIEADCSHWLA